MDIIEFKNYWTRIMNIYNEDMADGQYNPSKTAERIILNIGLSNAKECFATFGRLKRNDGRIFGENREWSNRYAINIDILCEESRYLLPDLDAIHTTHVDQVMTYIRKA